MARLFTTLPGGPLGPEWCYWLPRRFNKAADYLAGKARKRRRDGVWISERARHAAQRDLIAFTDAGVSEDGLETGQGWIVVDRKQEVLAMGWRYKRHGAGGAVEVNGEELEAAARAADVMVCLRGGRGSDLLSVQGWAITKGERQQAVKLLREHSGSGFG